ncbi:MAG: hypothetical protein WCT04_16370 [Planctomycetota bacterium]
MHLAEKIAAADLELDDESSASQPRLNPNTGISLMILFQMMVIPIYLFCSDALNRHYVELANHYIPAGFFFLCTAIVYLRLAHHHLLFWTPMTWFFVTSALLFGMGPLIYFYGTEYSIRFLDSYFVLTDEMLLRTNLLNAFGTLVVCLSHALACHVNWRPSSGERIENTNTLSMAKRVFWTILCFALPLKWLIFVPMYMDAFDFVIPAVIQNLANMLGVCIVLAFYISFSGQPRFIFIAVLLMASDALISTLTFSKTHFILPLIQASMGIYLSNRSRSFLVGGLVLSIVAYLWVKPLVDMGRSEFYHTSKSSASRMELVKNYFSGDIQASESITQANSQHWWTRQSFSSVEGYMINAYDNGSPGNTIRDFWVVLIPRILWPDKPNLSIVGTNLNKLIIGNDQTSIGGTIYGEAYWNGGWPMVLIVSTFVGAALFVLGQYSVYYLEVQDVRYVPIAMMGIFYGLDIQNWFIPAFVGTLPLFIGLWFFIKRLIRVKQTE